MTCVEQLARISLICSAPRVLAAFYASALGFIQTDFRIIEDKALGELLDLPMARAQIVTIQLGEQYLDLLGIEPRGRPYPMGVSGSSGLFQHFAMKFDSIDRAMSRLGLHSNWTAISSAGPQRLPASSGGVTAFKFRDPEGHPLELLETPRGEAALQRLPRIDHSAISVASTERSIAFYEQLGLRRTGGSFNAGPEQAQLDGIADAPVTVTALSLSGHPTPHLELLCYGPQFIAALPSLLPNDIAATWLVFSVQSEARLEHLVDKLAGKRKPVQFADGTIRSLLQDPDGHWLCLEVRP